MSKTLSALTSATTPLAGTEELYVVQGGNSRMTTSAAFYIPGGTDVAVADGGTGASTAAGARINLGLVIGTDVQAYDADLSSWAAVSRGAAFDAVAGIEAIPSIATTVALAAATVPNTINTIQISDFSSLGDGGGHCRKCVAVQPAWGGIRSTDRFLPNGTTDATNGGWWDVNEAAPNELMFGGVASASNAVQTAAIQSMLDYCSAFNAAKATSLRQHTITQAINVPAGITLEWAAGFTTSPVVPWWTKGFNGQMITLNEGSRLIRPQLNGAGATYTGPGVYVSSGNNQWIEDPFIFDTAAAAIDFPTGGVGVSSHCVGGYLSTHTVGGAAVTFPATELTTTGYRFFIAVKVVNSVYGLNNGNMTQIIGGYSGGLDFTGNTTGRVLASLHRCANALTTVIGTQHHITSCSFGGAVTLGGTASEVDFSGNIVSGTITLNSGALSNTLSGNRSTTGAAIVDNSANASNNIIDPIQTTFTASWKGVTTDPVLGNGTSTFSFTRIGRSLKIHGQFVMGSTTTFGSGTWYVELPLTGVVADGFCVGSVYVLDSGTAVKSGVATIGNGASRIQFNSDGGSNFWSAAAPIVWTTGDQLSFDITIPLK